MITIYYVEDKSYWTDVFGTELQIEDGGEMPLLFTKKSEAIERAKRMEDFYKKVLGYTTTIGDSEYPKKQKACLYAVRQENKDKGLRHEIRVYKTTTL